MQEDELKKTLLTLKSESGEYVISPLGVTDSSRMRALVEFIKQYSLEQRLTELNWAKTASVWNIENRITELKALKEER